MTVPRVPRSKQPDSSADVEGAARSASRDLAETIGLAAAFFVVIAELRSQRRRRRTRRFNRYTEALHAQPADPPTTLAHFWIGSLYARHGTSEQLDDWYRLTHGWPPLPTEDNDDGEARERQRREEAPHTMALMREKARSALVALGGQ